MRRVVEACIRHGVAPGIHLVRAETLRADLGARVAEGYRFLAIGSDLFLLSHAARTLHAEARAALEQRTD
jgi:2-keto-3-deoxy-L-rhamnonate aldolase RhmA